jgi:hypothetical protein
MCCTHLKIDEHDFQKEAGVPCVHLVQDNRGGHKCGIYSPDTRPSICRNFLCGWMQGVLQEGDRPDRSGVIVLPAAPMSGAVMDAIQSVRSIGYDVWNIQPVGNIPREVVSRIRKALNPEGVVFVRGDHPSGAKSALITFWETMLRYPA